jgi:hypothetical protein
LGVAGGVSAARSAGKSEPSRVAKRSRQGEFIGGAASIAAPVRPSTVPVHFKPKRAVNSLASAS